jgi:ABC-type phosphate transport system substrate-binding protein
MKKSLLSCFVALFTLAVNAETVFIVNKNLTEDVSKATLKKLYFGRTEELKNGKKVDVYLPKEPVIRHSVVSSFLKTSEKTLRRRYKKRQSSGEGKIPQTKGSAKILNLVSQSVNAIGVIDSSLVDDSVKVIHRF